MKLMKANFFFCILTKQNHCLTELPNLFSPTSADAISNFTTP